MRFVSFIARTATPASVAEGIRPEIRRVAPDLPIQSTVTMDEAVAESVAQARFRTLLLVLFATTAMLIATCSIYGMMAYAVTQRRGRSACAWRSSQEEAELPGSARVRPAADASPGLRVARTVGGTAAFPDGAHGCPPAAPRIDPSAALRTD